MSDTSERQYINVLIDSEMLKQIEDYRFENRLPSRTEAIRALVRLGLEKKTSPKKTAR